MRFKLDENLPIEAGVLFAANGHDVETVLSEEMGGSADELLIEKSRRERRVLVSLDLGFADIRRYPPQASPGVIVLRLENQAKDRVLAALSRVCELLSEEPLEGRLWIIDESRLRVRE